MSSTGELVSLLDDIKVVDADTHLTEPHDLWTSRAPAAYADRVPRVEQVEGRACWVFDGIVLGKANAGGNIRPDGSKVLGADFFEWDFEDGTLAASTLGPRLAMMDQEGIHAQIVYPNVVGFGGHHVADSTDETLRILCSTIFNDAMVELQEGSGNRIFPMALVPWWDLDVAIAEMQRIKELGLRGINLTSDTQASGLPDLGDRHWDRFWGAVQELDLPVNFHIGASQNQANFLHNAPWPSLGDDEKLALGSAVMYLTNARVIGNLIYSGVVDRFPRLRIVSVESGLGWLPFFLEALDYQLDENAPEALKRWELKPSEYFARNMAATFWFEGGADLSASIQRVGVDNCMFETDFPHPTCLYPSGVERAAEALASLDDVSRRKVLSSNAASIYHLPF